MTEVERILKYLNDKVYIGENSNRMCRKRIFVDPRNYLIGILYCKYHYTEQEIGIMIKRKRIVVHHSKHMAFQNRNDSEFLINTAEVRNEFPFIFTKPEFNSRDLSRRTTIKVPITASRARKLERYKTQIGIERTGTAIAMFIDEYIDNALKS